ncbi:MULTISPECIES: VOC family protein [Shewanella]|uniref:VOC family protein n=1 Tax=Shewanella TaxID=22 RepID=UPI001C658F63|nr:MULTISPECIES: VOC family protein [Shewanella]QYJ73974.1 VOC family protein [Shewanella sp. FJAT-52076]QYK03851.1 VOC family protein [Shewanella zhangzhouensis]
MAKVIGLGGVFFKSSDPEALANWYKTHLGMPVEHWGGCAFRALDLPKGSYSVWSPFDAGSDYFHPSRHPFMFNLVVDDLDAVLAQAAAGGAEVLPGREDTEFGRFGWFIDPDGNKVELWQMSVNS